MKILVITPNRLHLGYLGCYGNAWINTPNLDAFAAESVVFDQHYSDCPSPIGAWRAWRTGRYDFPLPGIPSVFPPQGATDLIFMLRAGGIPSMLVTDSPNALTKDQRQGGLWYKVCAFSGSKLEESYWPDLRKSVLKCLRELDSSEHGLVWLETNFLTPPWVVDESNHDYFSVDADEESSEESIEPLLHPSMGLVDPADDRTFVRLQRTYAATVSRLDRELGELWDDLRRHDLYDSLMMVITTDRGFSLAEHGLVGDGRPWLYEELVHIPLMIRHPHGAPSGRRIGALTQPVDLMPTLLGAFLFPSPDSHGSVLLPWIRGDRDPIRNFACLGLEIGGEIEYSLRTLDWAFLLPDDTGSRGLRPPFRERQLYVKPDDRWELNNVIQHHPEVAEYLEQMLRAFMKAPSLQAHRLPSVGFERANPNT